MKVPLGAVIVGAVAVLLSFAWPFARGAGDAIGDSGTPPASPAQRYALILVLDGVRYDEIDLAHMPNLASLLRSGTTYTQASVGALPSVTETSHATIGTGVLPSRHHILGDSWRLPGTNRMAPNLLDTDMDRTGYIDKLLQQANVPSLAGILHGKYKNALVASLSAHKVYAASAMGGGHADFEVFGVRDSRHHFVPAGTPGRTPDAKVLKDPALDLPTYPRKAGVEDDWAATLGIKMLQRYRPRALMINFPEPDVAGHMAGTNPRVIQPILVEFDKSLGRLLAAYRSAGLLSRTDVIVTADHGMVPGTYTVTTKTLFSVIRKAGGDPLDVGHGDFSVIYLKNPGKISKVASALASARIPHVVAVYKKAASGAYQLVSPPAMLHSETVQPAYGNLLATFASPASPDIVLLYDENTMTMTDSYREIGRIGDHEGATWGSQHITLIASGPGIRAAYQSGFPAHLVDIAPTIETLLGAKPRRQDGVPLADMMTAAPSWASSSQSAMQSIRMRDVQGLEAEAGIAVNQPGAH